MATSTAQRTGIWVITIAMIAGTIISFVMMIIGSQTDNQSQKVIQDYNKEYAAYEKKVDAQAKKLSKKYYASFKKYESVPEKFNAKSITKRTVKDLKVGTGKKIAKADQVAVYYIGWNPKGKAFDQSISGKSLSAPIDPSGTIEGFSKGVIGMKVGGVRVISIPAKEAYGDKARSEDIPANTPLKFLVMAIKKPATISEPEVPQEVIDAYSIQ